MDWDKLRIFHAVAEAGSFTHAGETLNLSQSAVSRQISALEDSLKTPLFHRHARGLVLTEQGEVLYRTAHDIFAKLAMTEAVLTDAKDRPRGELKVTATVSFGSNWIAPRIREFADLYPDVVVTLLLDDHELDLSMREADVAIRMRKPTQPDLIQRKLISLHYHIYASPEYLKRFGMPKNLDDLEQHRLITYGDGAPSPIADVNWLMTAGMPAGRRRHTVLTVNNTLAILRAVESGLGIAAIPDYLADGNARLVPILTELKPPAFDAYFVYPEELRHSKRIAVFRDFLLRKVSDWRF
ncbi:MAG: LysR family transcriptional regulator [Alphaproteobacteria bacterium]|nr:LysR family transcriptional regulator [Alphaproteobacteria bacterium]MCW5751379.1 LysR family transcriptional regulator [Alphaproteobacteria bacterium]